MELFRTDIVNEKTDFIPLAERMRPKNLDEVYGQNNVLGKIKKLQESNYTPSLILWGAPGSGKTTIANLIAKNLKVKFEKLSAVEAGVKELRKIIEIAEKNKSINKKTILFIDEIHRFNKSQQDSLLHAVESGSLILIGATTENPSFEVNAALLSRMQVYKLNELDGSDLKQIAINAIENDEILSKKEFLIDDLDPLINISGGDARAVLKYLEILFNYQKSRDKIQINKQLIEEIADRKIAGYDKKGESHYDTISAFIKSMRGSDPDASIFWLAKMIDAGEDPKFIARRLVIFASEDIGNADPGALSLAKSVFDAVNLIGYPECRINLAQGVTYLAVAPKSNASYKAINEALADIRKGVNTSVPLPLRNAPTKLMKNDGYGADYKYPHDYENNFIRTDYFPKEFSKKQYYRPTLNGKEAKISERLKKLWVD
ncbi:replication-associated recombination protein A [Candidatus Kapabacteria bacterium]|nr:replication-associated recombination protein A [Candidatus Kapabacteria bacterium]